MPLQIKIETIAKEMYGAQSVEFSENVLIKLNNYESKVVIYNILYITDFSILHDNFIYIIRKIKSSLSILFILFNFDLINILHFLILLGLWKITNLCSEDSIIFEWKSKSKRCSFKLCTSHNGCLCICWCWIYCHNSRRCNLL